MQKNALTMKRKLLVDGIELPGLAKVAGLKDEEVTVEVPTFARILTIKSGVKKFDPITVTYIVNRGQNSQTYYYNWKKNDELHDVIIINTDGSGAEMYRWILRDCEVVSLSEPDYDAAHPEYFSFTAVFNTTQAPDILPA